jgi:hypothetical protein
LEKMGSKNWWKSLKSFTISVKCFSHLLVQLCSVTFCKVLIFREQKRVIFKRALWRDLIELSFRQERDRDFV